MCGKGKQSALCQPCRMYHRGLQPPWTELVLGYFDGFKLGLLEWEGLTGQALSLAAGAAIDVTFISWALRGS